MHLIVAGCGRVGSQLAISLSYEGHDVVVIDSNPASFSRLGTTFNGITLEGQAFDEEVLKEAGIEGADALAAVTDHDSTNLMVAEIAQVLFSVPMVVARLYDPDAELTFRRMEVDYVCGTTLLAERLKKKILQREIMVQYEDEATGMRIIEFTLPPAAAGRPASRLNDGKNARLLMVIRGNRRLSWDDDTELRRGDRVVMAVREAGWGDTWDFLAEEPVCRARKGVSLL